MSQQQAVFQDNEGFNVRTATFDFMRRVGVNTIFGNPGSTELGMFYDFPEDFKYVLGLQEATVVGMADGYAQATGNASFVNLHSAAGVGNAMGNIFTAFKNRTPMVITAGQQARSLFPYDPYLYSTQAAELAKPYVKWSIEPARAEDVPKAIARAYYLAMLHPQGPVLVSIPSDDWDKATEPVDLCEISSQSVGDVHALRLVAKALDEAQRPALIVGAEVDRDGAWDETVRLAEKSKAAVFVAPLAGRRGFPENHPQFRGFLPGNREQIVKVLAGHDVVVVLGAPLFTYHVEGKGPHVPHDSKVFVLSADPDVIARTPIGTAVLGGVCKSIEVMNEHPFNVRKTLPTPRKRAEQPSPDVPMSVAFVLSTLADIRQPEDIIVEEAPTARLVMNEHLPILCTGTFYTMDSGGLGFGMPAAVGIGLALPKRRVICVIGDGSAMYSEQAMWSAAQLKLNITFLIINNGKYAAMKRFASVFNFPPDMEVVGTDLPGLDFVSLAEGHGVPAVTVSEPLRLVDALNEALNADGPRLVNAIVS